MNINTLINKVYLCSVCVPRNCNLYKSSSHPPPGFLTLRRSHHVGRSLLRRALGLRALGVFENFLKWNTACKENYFETGGTKQSTFSREVVSVLPRESKVSWSGFVECWSTLVFQQWQRWSTCSICRNNEWNVEYPCGFLVAVLIPATLSHFR